MWISTTTQTSVRLSISVNAIQSIHCSLTHSFTHTCSHLAHQCFRDQRWIRDSGSRVSMSFRRFLTRFWVLLLTCAFIMALFLQNNTISTNHKCLNDILRFLASSQRFWIWRHLGYFFVQVLLQNTQQPGRVEFWPYGQKFWPRFHLCFRRCLQSMSSIIQIVRPSHRNWRNGDSCQSVRWP